MLDSRLLIQHTPSRHASILRVIFFPPGAVCAPARRSCRPASSTARPALPTSAASSPLTNPLSSAAAPTALWVNIGSIRARSRRLEDGARQLPPGHSEAVRFCVPIPARNGRTPSEAFCPVTLLELCPLARRYASAPAIATALTSLSAGLRPKQLPSPTLRCNPPLSRTAQNALNRHSPARASFK